MLRRVILIVTLAAITAALLALGAGGAPAAVNTTSDGQRIIDCAQQKAKVCKGTSENDLIYGSQGNDDINPFGGDDEVYAYGGDDSVRHSYGNDIIWGGTGADTLRGGFDLDTIYGNEPTTDPTTGETGDLSDGDHDLIDCAFIASRGNTGDDLGFGAEEDTVVDCSNE
jgi:Ca2+-binding RTX toxin-like protein